MASFQFNVDVKGGPELLRRMRELPIRLQRSGGRKAARRAMLVVRTSARAAARQFDDPSSPRKIWKNIVIQESTKRGKRLGGVVMRVGVRGGARQYADTRENRRAGRVGDTYKTLGSSSNPGGDTWYWRLVEFGTQRSRARPFLRPALMNNAQAVSDALTTEMARELDHLVSKGVR